MWASGVSGQSKNDKIKEVMRILVTFLIHKAKKTSDIFLEKLTTEVTLVWLNERKLTNMLVTVSGKIALRYPSRLT